MGLNAATVEAAKALPLLSGLDEGSLGRLLGSATAQRHPAETALFEAGESAEHLHVLMSGLVELYAGRRPGECALMLMAKGDVFMPAATLFEEPYLNSARTLESSRILRLPAAAVRTEFARSHPFAINLSRALAGHFRMAARHIIDLRSRNAPERLGRFLLRLVDESGGADAAELPTAKQHLAARVGMTPATLSRNLQTLADHGLVVRGTRIIVRDRKRIERFCGGVPHGAGGEQALDVNVL